jgi:hypothetical protein
MLKLIFSIIGGVVIAFAVVFAADALFHRMASTPAPSNTSDKEAMRAYVASQPAGTLFAVVIGWALAAFAGSAFAARFAGRGQWPGLVVAGLFLLATSLNLMIVVHPTWMVIAAILMIVAAGWFGSALGARPAAGRLSDTT